MTQDYRRDNKAVGDEEIRMYGPRDGSLKWPSVSEVLNARSTPEKDKGIEGWKNWFDGTGDKRHWRDIRNYAGWRNTLIHYKILDRFADRDLMGEEEVEAYQELKGWRYNYEDALERAKGEIDWAVNAFDEIAPRWEIAQYDEDGEVLEDNVRDVERMVAHDQIGYGGQFDISWHRSDGVTVMGDLKASNADDVSGLIDKKWPRYAMQLAAYAKAVPYEVDELAVIWVNPKSRSNEVIPESDWPQDRAAYEEDFISIAETIHQEQLDNWNS